MTSCDHDIGRYYAFDGASALFAIVLFCCTRNCSSNDPEIGGIVLIVCGISQIITGTLLATVLYPSDCILTLGMLSPIHRSYGFAIVLIGISWITRGFRLLLGGNNDDNNDEQERISRRMNDDETSCIPQSLILNDKIKREERRRSSVKIGSGIYGDSRSSFEIGQALESPLLQSAEEGMPQQWVSLDLEHVITWDPETGERIINEDTQI